MKNHSRHFVAATCALAAFSPVEMMAQKQPNFVIIVADDMGMVMWVYMVMSI